MSEFKDKIKIHLRHVVAVNGGLADLARRVSEVPSTVSFLAGYVCGLISFGRYVDLGTLAQSALSQDEVRLVHDVVRTTLASEG